MAKKKKADKKDTPGLSLRDEMRSKLTAGVDKRGTRDVSVMTRLSQDLVDILDNLVKLGIFKSRSDAVAAIIEKTLLTQKESFELLEAQVKRLEEIQGDAMDIALKALEGE